MAPQAGAGAGPMVLAPPHLGRVYASLQQQMAIRQFDATNRLLEIGQSMSALPGLGVANL